MADTVIPSNDPDTSTFSDLFNQAASVNPDEGSTGEAPAPDPVTGDQPYSSTAPQNENPDTGSSDVAGKSDETVQEDTPQEPENADDRIRYWQSRADKYQAELQKKQQQAEDNPLLKHINENPEVAAKFYAELAGKGSSNDVPSQPETPKLERPQKPERPEGFDLQDALTDPDSPSAKYQQAMTEYNEQLVEYNENLSAQREAEEKARQNAIAQQQKQQEQIKEVYDEAVYRYGMKPNEASEFIKWSTSPDYGMKELVQLYRIVQKNRSGDNPAANAINDRNQRLNNPAPPVTSGNVGNPNNAPDNRSEEQIMAESFMQGIKEFSGQ